ncbi:U3 snoRNP protein [Lecanora helva]
MAPTSEGKRSRPRKLVKGGTTSSRKHHFESFTQRIAKLNIDPVRRHRPNDVGEGKSGEQDSFFRTSLEHWKGHNQTECFTSFTKEVDSISNNLPKVLHHNQRIFDNLVSYIDRRDTLALEPLLDLLASLAHDLGAKFEGHFERALTLVTSVAAKHKDVEAIEWSFTCLAWLFKYLSRLLVPNLKPVFEVIAPLLGKEAQRPHTIKFAAEAMSFLIRKAGTVYIKNPRPLNIIMEVIRDDIISCRNTDGNFNKNHSYQRGLMTLLVNSIKGIERKLHSSGASIYGCMISLLVEKYDQGDGFDDVASGVTVALTHHCDAETLHPILDIVFEQIKILETSNNHGAAAICGHLLFVVSAVRKGTRINNWTSMLDAMLQLLNVLGESAYEAVPKIFKAAAVILQSSPLNLVLSKFRLAMNVIASDQFAIHFLYFCQSFHRLGKQRFRDLMLPYLSKFIATHWQAYEPELCLALPRLTGGNISKKIVCPKAWQDLIISTFEVAKNGEDSIIQCHNYIKLMDSMKFTDATKDQIYKVLGMMVDEEISVFSTLSSRNLFTLGAGLKVLCHQTSQEQLRINWPMLYAQAARLGSYVPFLEAVLMIVDNDKACDGNVDVLVDALVENTHCASHDLRKISLQILDLLCTKRYEQQAEILQIALTIEDSPLDFQSAESVKMQVRKLGLQYEQASSYEWLQKIICNFCFGVLTFRLSPLWNDAINVLKTICKTKGGEEIIASLTFRWLEEPRTKDKDADSFGSSSSGHREREPLTDFQCINLTQVENLSERCGKEMKTASKHLQTRFETSLTITDQKIEKSANIALRVLLAVPHVAEKRSRQLVPNLLSWASNDAECTESPIGEEITSSPAPELPRRKLGWQEQRAMLDLFGLFNNPRVLYRTSDVFDALQALLTNGNVNIQTSALKALFTWKLQGVQPYEENLLNLLDEARFRDEISTFLQLDEENSMIRDEHRRELMPIMLRLLYGKMIANSDSKSQSTRRKAVLQALSRSTNEYLHDFVNISLGRLSNAELFREGHLQEKVLKGELLNVRRQVGLLNMMKDMLEVLGDRLIIFSQNLTSALLYCLVREARSDTPGDSLRKQIRNTGLQCLNLLFQHCPASTLHWCVLSIFKEVVSPRLDKLPIETAQSVSGILRLFSTWVSSQDTAVYLTEYDTRTVGIIIDCLAVPSAKDSVKLFVLENILKPIVELSKFENDGSPNDVQGYRHNIVLERVLQPNMEKILIEIGTLLRKSPSKEVLATTIQSISGLASLVKDSTQIINLLETCVFLLNQPSSRVNPRSKGELLQVIKFFVPLSETQLPPDLQDQIFRTVSSLFGYFRDRENRVILSEVLEVLAEKDAELPYVAELCINLNAFSRDRVDQPDFDERLKAFNAINEEKFEYFNAKQWRPILYNMLYYIKDNKELSIRSNASYALRRFIEVNPVTSGNFETESSDLCKNVLLPSLLSGVAETSELVRTEYLTVMAHLIRKNPQWEAIKDMLGLLVGDDEEASFFSNILHIQQHRRLRALRRLAGEASQGTIRSANVAHFFLPLIEPFVFDKAEEDSAHNLSAETVITIGALAASLEWPQYRAIFRRYSSYIQAKPDLEKTVIKLLGRIVDALSGAVKGEERTSGEHKNISDIDYSAISTTAGGFLAKTMPRKEKLADDLANNLLPALENYLHDKDESTVSMRVPVAVSVVKLLKLLPLDRFRARLPPVLTDICHILRSRAQESRDLTRKALVDISMVLGPPYFDFVLSELRSSLSRGYQLHVLSYTVHSILVATSSIFRAGDLDYCLPQLVNVVMDDIFGAVGQEKEAEDYISKMKEVKSSKSYDSMELIAKITTIGEFGQLIKPLQSLLEEKVDLRMVKKIDELLRRIGVGLLRNEAIQDQRVLVFCYEIINDVYKAQDTKQRPPNQDHKTERFLINHKGANKYGERGSTTSYKYKLVRFALDLFRSVLHKYDSLQTPANLSQFIPVIGDAVIHSNEEIQISALRLLTTIIKVPLKAIDENAPVYVAECVKIVKASPSTNVESAQAALKLVSAILRERRTIDIRERDLAYLLKRLIPDLEEPDKQGIAFNFLKAIMSRKIIITEVYEVLDVVAGIMVTNQTKGARDMARGAYLHFIMEYPQTQERFEKQVGFLVRNLDYKHQEGRQSVMEAVHLLFNKVDKDLVQDIIIPFFWPLVLQVINDESKQCREMASELVKKIFECADAERTKSLLGLLSDWLSTSKGTFVNRVALQMYGLYFDTKGAAAEKELPPLQLRLTQILKSNLKLSAEGDFELPYFALETFSKICRIFPSVAFATNSASLWASVRQWLSFPHAWVKLSSAKLLGTRFADFSRTNAGNDDLSLPLKGSGGLWLNETEIVEVTRASLSVLRIPGVSEDLANQIVRNLVFLGKIMAQTSVTWPQRSPTTPNVAAATNDVADNSTHETSDEGEQVNQDSDSFEGFDPPTPTPPKPGIRHLISQTARLLRRGPLTTHSPSLTPLHASLRLLGALSISLPLPTLTANLPTILLPLHNLTDSSIPAPTNPADNAFTEGYKALVANAQEFLGQLQGRVGTGVFLETLGEVRKGVRERREERRVKRRIEAVGDVEGAEERKRRRGVRKKEKRRERGQGMRGLRRGW